MQYTIALGIYMLNYLHQGEVIPDTTAALALVGVLLFVSWIGFGRVYLAMHFPADVAVGAGLGMLSLFMWVLVEGAWKVGGWSGKGWGWRGGLRDRKWGLGLGVGAPAVGL